MNLYVVNGNLTRDIELRYTPSGSAVAHFGLANNRRYSKSNGEPATETTYLDCEIWGKQAETLAKHTKKGTPLLIQGSLKNDNWEKDGQKRSRIVIRVERFDFLNERRKSNDDDEEDIVTIEDSVDALSPEDVKVGF